MIFVNVDAWLGELERVAAPHFRTVTELEHVLSAMFNQTQQDVHVITGSLRGSGRPSSEFDGEVWSGTISYGGPSPGFPNDPVEYAQYEWGRGGDHDYLRNLPGYYDQIENVIHHHFNG